MPKFDHPVLPVSEWNVSRAIWTETRMTKLVALTLCFLLLSACRTVEPEDPMGGAAQPTSGVFDVRGRGTNEYIPLDHKTARVRYSSWGFGLVRDVRTFTFEGERSTVRFKVGAPLTFRVRVTAPYGAAVSLQVADFVRLAAQDHQLVAEVARLRLFTPESESFVPYRIERLNRLTFTISPERALPPGEYALVANTPPLHLEYKDGALESFGSIEGYRFGVD